MPRFFPREHEQAYQGLSAFYQSLEGESNAALSQAGLDWAPVILGDCYSIDFAAYAEPPHDVVTETGPSSFHGSFPPSTASKLSKSTALLDPGVRELGDL